MTDLRCHFDASGWLRGPVSITHVMTPNRYDSGFALHPQGVVLHTEDGYEAGTVATFMNPASQVSAFFSIGSDGSCHQYLPVGQGYVAWSQAAGNGDWRGIEDEDGTHPSIPLTDAQITTFAQILEALSRYDGFPLQVTDDVNGKGLITHSAGGLAWGGHFGCPGTVRAAQRPAIIAKAKEIRAGGNPPPSVVEHITAGEMTLAELAEQHKTDPSTILRLTAERAPGGIFPAPVAAYVNSVFGGSVPVSVKIPAGLTLWIPA